MYLNNRKLWIETMMNCFLNVIRTFFQLSARHINMIWSVVFDPAVTRCAWHVKSNVTELMTGLGICAFRCRLQSVCGLVGEPLVLNRWCRRRSSYCRCDRCISGSYRRAFIGSDPRNLCGFAVV